MSISQSLANALSGLTASSRSAEIVSSNLANSLTEGYGRRQLNLSAQSIGGAGTGVRIDGVSRLVDRGILADRRLADAVLGQRSTTVDFLKRLENLIGSGDEESALSSRIANVEQALVEASADPSSDIRLQNVVNSFNRMAVALNDASRGVQGLRREADTAIADDISTLNSSLKMIDQLNSDITFHLNSGNDATALMDERQRLIDQVSAIVPVREMPRQGSQVALITTGGVVLLDGTAAEFSFTPVHTVTAEMTLASGALSAIYVNGSVIAAGPNAPLGGGSLSAAFELRDATLTEAQTGLDALARDLIERFQDPATDPTVGPATPGLLTDQGAVFDPLNTDGLASRISLNVSVDPAQGGALTALRDGMGATSSAPVGDSSQIQRWLDALAAPKATYLGGSTGSAAGHAARLSSIIGGNRLSADQDLSFASARWETLRQAELSGGVDSDFELQMLLRIEQAYAANAKVVQVVQSLIQILMGL